MTRLLAFRMARRYDRQGLTGLAWALRQTPAAQVVPVTAAVVLVAGLLITLVGCSYVRPR